MKTDLPIARFLRRLDRRRIRTSLRNMHVSSASRSTSAEHLFLRDLLRAQPPSFTRLIVDLLCVFSPALLNKTCPDGCPSDDDGGVTGIFNFGGFDESGLSTEPSSDDVSCTASRISPAFFCSSAYLCRISGGVWPGSHSSASVYPYCRWRKLCVKRAMSSLFSSSIAWFLGRATIAGSIQVLRMVGLSGIASMDCCAVSGGGE